MATKYTKDNKIYTLPIKIETEKGISYTNNEEIILANGYSIYVKPKPSLESLIRLSEERINSETDDIILNNFVYQDNEFYLTMENQTNFANMFIAKDFLTYPQRVKTKTGFMELNSKEEVQMFYLAGVAFVKECLENGWVRKEEEAIRITNEYNEENNQ